MTAFKGELNLGAELDLCHSAAQFPLGTLARGSNGNLYRYVKFEDAVAYVLGHFVNIGAGETTWNVTNDISAAMAGYVGVGLVFQAVVPTQNQYGWVQVAGIGTIHAGSAAIIAGDWLKQEAVAMEDVAAVAALELGGKVIIGGGACAAFIVRRVS